MSFHNFWKLEELRCDVPDECQEKDQSRDRLDLVAKRSENVVRNSNLQKFAQRNSESPAKTTKQQLGNKEILLEERKGRIQRKHTYDTTTKRKHRHDSLQKGGLQRNMDYKSEEMSPRSPMISEIKSLLRIIHQKKLKKARSNKTRKLRKGFKPKEGFCDKVIKFQKQVSCKKPDISCIYDTFNPVQVKSIIQGNMVKVIEDDVQNPALGGV
ncbi:unnamed protein product [Moneuplotes crassus]|uniref:Uncharacterized protein n=1 Tax=Euplotes crassus TaxID=5936 RepID=A0AAD2D6F4_EUPCR|nr:unnamed protein product [Moneuplotes crassus]